VTDEIRSGAGGPGRTILFVLIGAVALALVAALTLGGGEPVGDPDGLETGPVVVAGEALPEFAGTPGDLAVGMMAPDFDATTFDGRDVLVRPGEGSGYVLAFFAHWCPHCQAEVPKLVEWIGRGGIPDGVEVVAVSTAVYLDRGNPPRAWLAGEGWPVVAVRDDDVSTVADAYGLRSFPYFVVVGTDGRVRGRIGGGLAPEAWNWALDQAGRSGAVHTGADSA
jgi:thiol-disulfide isomerase/thioredoxin